MAWAAAAIAILGGLPLIALGAFLFTLEPRRRAQLAFAAFAVLWGAQTAVANAARLIPDPAWHRIALIVAIALLVPATVCLVHFAALQWPTRPMPSITLAPLAVGAVALVVLGMAPDQLVRVVLTDGAPRGFPGPLALPLVHGPFQVALLGAAALLYHAYRGAKSDAAAERMRLLLAALLLFVSYATVFNLAAADYEARRGDAARAALVPFYAAALALLAALVATELVRPRGARPSLWLVAAVAVPVTVAVVETRVGPPLFGVTLGAWRILGVAALVYGIAKYQLFDLELRVKTTVKRGILLGIFIAAFFLAEEIAQNYVSDRFGVVIGLLAAAALVPVASRLRGLAQSVVDTTFPPHIETPSYQQLRKLQVFRAALEGSYRDGLVTDVERRVLDRLRADLDIPHEDAEALERDVRTLIAPRPSAV